MENQNGNQMNTQGGDLSQLKKMFTEFQKKQTQGGGRKSREDLLAKYFVPRKPKEIFRILPPKAGKRHIEEAFFHVVTSNASGGKKKHGTIVYCPAHNDPKVPKLDGEGKPILDMNGNQVLVPAPCPACAKHKELLSKQDPSLKGIKKENMNDAQLKVKAKNDEIYKEAIKWDAKKFYIVRGIDKGLEKDGVKFWRFKHNYRNQGSLDKLLPILEEYYSTQKADFSDPENGTDLTIMMADSEFNGHVYKTISAITYRGKSKLHTDPIIAREWLDDDISWRDVFLPKKAPNVTPHEYLEMLVSGTSPYWDDSDQNNKRWVFPGRPDLEELANNRSRNLDADTDKNFEQASDLTATHTNNNVTIGTITESKVTEYKDDAMDVGAQALAETKPKAQVLAETEPVATTPIDTVPADDTSDNDSDNYDDLPF